MSRSFRIFKCGTFGPKTALAKVLDLNPDLPKKTYQEQKELIFSKKVSYSDAFSRAMQALGHQAEEVMADIPWHQMQWARENGIEFDPAKWQSEVLTAQIRKYKPEILYFQGDINLPRNIWDNVKQVFPSVRKTVVHSGFPQNLEALKLADLVLVATRSLVRQYSDLVFEVVWFTTISIKTCTNTFSRTNNRE